MRTVPKGFVLVDKPSPFTGVLRGSIRDFQRHHWKVMRLVWRKGWMVEITERRGGDPIVNCVPHQWYQSVALEIGVLAGMHE